MGRRVNHLTLIIVALFSNLAAAELVFDDSWNKLEEVQLRKAFTRLPFQTRALLPLMVKKSEGLSDLFEVGKYIENSIYLANDYENSQEMIREFYFAVFLKLDQLRGYSEDQRWRKISGWPDANILQKLKSTVLHTSENQDHRAFADNRGLSNASYDFATFAAHYFSPEIVGNSEHSLKCRTPIKFKYFAKVFPHQSETFHEITCKSIDRGFLDDIQFIHPLTRKELDLGPINYESVEGFELLYATPGVGEMAEVAGHLLLRIKLKNNPFAESNGIENPYDIVVSFLADTNEGKSQTAREQSREEICRETGIFGKRTHDNFNPMDATTQALRGLSGGFLTTFDRNTLYATVFNYTVLQDRNLLRFQLELDDKQKRNLLDRLYVAKKNYKSKYYFFDRNCASILIKVIAEGIDRPSIESFDPIVSPPNSLVALMRREGLLTPVFPAFHGYRKEAQIAQKLIAEELLEIRSNLAITRPSNREFFSKSESKRLKAWKALLEVTTRKQALQKTNVLRIAQLLQISEKLYLDRKDLCTPFTSTVVAAAREYIVRYDNYSTAQRLDHTIQLAHLDSEKKIADTGSKHTGLLALRAATVNRGISLGMSVHKQQMGDISAHAMQRTSEVILGQFDTGIIGADGIFKLSDISATGLKIRKFRDQLDIAPTIFSPQRSFGIGLALLNYGKSDQQSELEYARAETLFSLYSENSHDRHFYISTGMAAKRIWSLEENVDTVTLPVGFHGLWTFDKKRDWQLRATLEYEYLLKEIGKRRLFRSSQVSLARNLRGGQQSDLVIYINYINEQFDEDSFQLGIEINRW